jgi:uncharacterized membrane protein
MQNENPYSSPALPTSVQTANRNPEIRKVNVNPIELFKRGYALLGDQYWLFLGIAFIAILIGSAVPFGLLMGPMLVGVFICLLHRERGQRVEFGTVFRGFDQFMDSFIATLIMVGASLLLMIPLVIFMLIMILTPIIRAAQNGQKPPEPDMLTILLMYPLIILVSVIIYVPFLFTFQLIADRKLKGSQAVMLSARAAWKNLGGIVWFLFVLMCLSILLMIMCYLPALLFMPISLASMFVLYRDIFPLEPVDDFVAA